MMLVGDIPETLVQLSDLVGGTLLPHVDVGGSVEGDDFLRDGRGGGGKGEVGRSGSHKERSMGGVAGEIAWIVT